MGFLSKVRLLIATENIPEWEQDLDPKTDIQALYVHFKQHVQAGKNTRGIPGAGSHVVRSDVTSPCVAA